MVACVMFTSCENKEENSDVKTDQQSELFLQMQARFEKVGVVNMIDNYTLTAKDISTIKKVSSILDDVPSLKIATHRIEYADGSVVYAFNMPDEKLSVVKVVNEQIVREFVCEVKEIGSNQYVAVTEKGLESYVPAERFTLGHSTTPTSMAKISANCDELGGRRINESFNRCFERNWDNFCCDFAGCLAKYTNPHLVAIAIAVTCVC